MSHVALALSLLALTGEAGAASVCRTGGSGLNLRSSGSLHARRQATLPVGASFEVLATNGSWLRVRAGGRTGWVYASYVCGTTSPETTTDTPITSGGASGSGPLGTGGAPGAGSTLNGGDDVGGRNGDATVGSRPNNAPGDIGLPGSSSPGSSFPGSSFPGSSSPGSSSPGSSSPGSSSPGSSSPGSSSPGSSSPGSSAPGGSSPASVANAAESPESGNGECAAPAPVARALDPLDGIDPFCVTCVASRLEALGRTLDDAAAHAASVARVGDTITAITAAEETGARTPDWGQITVDSGGITYGAYQHSRRSGELAKLIREYVANATPSAETRALLRHARMLDGGRGAPLDRSKELKRLLRNAASDPVMQQTQKDYFRRTQLEPALADAAAAGIRSPLGASVWLDLQLNGGLEDVVRSARRVAPRVQTAADEARFVRALIDAREARFRRLAHSRKFRQYLPGWLSRNNDFRKLLNAGNLDLAGNVPLPAKDFAICGGSTQDAAAFRAYMASLARTS